MRSAGWSLRSRNGSRHGRAIEAEIGTDLQPSSASNRKLPDAIPCVFDQDQGAGFKLCEPFTENRREVPIHRVGSFIRQSADDDARLVQDAKGEDVTEVEIERHDNAGIGRARSMSTRSAARSSPNVRT
jgi:hypothetical protein